MKPNSSHRQVLSRNNFPVCETQCDAQPYGSHRCFNLRKNLHACIGRTSGGSSSDCKAAFYPTYSKCQATL